MPHIEKIQFDSLLSEKFFKQQQVIDEILPDSSETLKEFLKSPKGKEFKRCCAELIDNLIAWIKNYLLPDDKSAIIAIDKLKNFKEICTQYEGEDEAANSDYYDLYRQGIPLLALIVNTPIPLDARKELMSDLISDDMLAPESALTCIAITYSQLINLNSKISEALPPLDNDLIEFLDSPKGKEFLKFFASCVDELIQWSDSNLQGKEKNDTVNALQRFKEIYTKDKRSEETAARYLRMYREGTYRLMHLAQLMQDGAILLATRQSVIRNMTIPGNLTVCSDGAYSRIDSAATNYWPVKTYLRH
jgi:hypothetical protein